MDLSYYPQGPSPRHLHFHVNDLYLYSSAVTPAHARVAHLGREPSNARVCEDMIQSFVREVESNVSVTIVSTPGVAVCRVCDILCFGAGLGFVFSSRAMIWG